MGKRGRTRKLEPDKVAAVLDMLKRPGLTNNAIGGALGVDPKTVKKLRTKHEEEMNEAFFSQRLREVSHEELMKICLDPSFDPSPNTSKAGRHIPSRD